MGNHDNIKIGDTVVLYRTTAAAFGYWTKPHPGTYGTFTVVPSDLPSGKELLSDDGHTRRGFGALDTKLWRLVSHTPACSNRDDGDWRNKISRALGVQPGEFNLSLDEAVDRIAATESARVLGWRQEAYERQQKHAAEKRLAHVLDREQREREHHKAERRFLKAEISRLRDQQGWGGRA